MKPSLEVVGGGKPRRAAAAKLRFVYTGKDQQFPAGTTVDIGPQGGLSFSWLDGGEKHEWVIVEVFRTSSVWREVPA